MADKINDIDFNGAKKFRRPIAFIAIGILLIIAFSNTVTLIRPGYVGVLIKRNGGGISPNPLNVGFHFRWPIIEEIEEYPVFMQTLVLTKDLKEGNADNEEINVNSVEGQPVSCDASISFEIDPGKVPQLYTTFRKDITSIAHGFVRQTIRQVMQEVVGQTEIVAFIGKDKARIVNDIETELQKRLGPYGFVIKQFTLNEIRAPQSIVKAIEAKNAMAQDALRSQNELQKKQFEAEQRVIEAEGEAKATLTRAEAQAKSNRMLAESITPTLVEYRRIERWDGKMPQVSGNATPFINLQK